MDVHSAESRLANDRRAYEDAQTRAEGFNREVITLQSKLGEGRVKEQQKIQEITRPFGSKEAAFEQLRKAFEIESQKFKDAETNFRKHEAIFAQKEAEFRKEQVRQRVQIDNVSTVINIEEKRLERQIEASKGQATAWRMKAENFRRDMELAERTLAEARKIELENLHKNTANSNHAPSTRRFGT